MSEIYVEQANQLPVYDRCDILIVGAGAAGHSAAIAAARANRDAKIILMERYGYFGGDVTGGYVLMVPSLSWGKYSIIRGIQEEWFTRLDKTAPNTVLGPRIEDLDKNNPMMVNRWSLWPSCTSPTADGGRILARSLSYDPQELKIEMDLMVQEQPNISSLLHCWGTKPIMENGEIKGVIFESKAGRKAVFAKIVIDATGDGDIYAQAGAPFHGKSGGIAGESQRDDQTALVWRVGGVDYDAYARWSKANPEAARSFSKELIALAGYTTAFFPAGCNDIVWFNNWLRGMNCIDLDDIRVTEFKVRNTIRKLLAFCKENLPFAFKNAYLLDIAPQLGVRCSRRLDGEVFMTMQNFADNTEFEDVIAWSTTGAEAPIEIPYRCILPKNVDNLICPGRHLSADVAAIGPLQLIPQCCQTGQAAGVAAAVAIKDGTTAKTVDIKKVQYILSHEQDVPLPRQDNTDPQLVADLEACNYGRDSERAKKIRASLAK